MDEFTAGRLKIRVFNPYPCTVVLTHQDKYEIRLTHTEMADLEYILKRAMLAARKKLKADADEV